MSNSKEDIYVCPSFSSYSSGKLAEIALRVAADDKSGGQTEDDDDFEFALVRQDQEVFVEKFFDDGQIEPVFPVFNSDLVLDNGGEVNTGSENAVSESSTAIPLSELFIEEDMERDNPPSCSSSDADELENIPAGTYCVWRPKVAESPMPNQCKKSKSTGSVSKRWKLRDLLRRSNSDGKDSFVFLTPTHLEQRPEKSSVQASTVSRGKGVRSAAGVPGSPSAHEALYVRNRAAKEWEKKKSFLPYRQDLVGLFANVNGLRQSFPRF